MGGRGCTPAWPPELATSWGQATCHVLGWAPNVPAAMALRCSVNAGVRVGGTESSVGLLKHLILYHIPPTSHSWSSHSFFFSIALITILISYGSPSPSREVSSLRPEAALLEHLAHGGYSITLCGTDEWNARGLGRQHQSAYTEALGGPGALISQLSQRPATSGLPKRISTPAPS